MRGKGIAFFLIGFLLFTGCANSRLLLRKGQKKIEMKPEEGGVIFSLKIAGQTTFNPYNVTIQEINQYKIYKQKKLELVPLGATLGDLYLFHLKLSKGTYRLASFYGWIGKYAGNYQYMPCNKIFDVKAGKITYLGRIGSNMYSQGNSWANDIVIIDFYEEDVDAFLKRYPLLEGKKISKDLLY